MENCEGKINNCIINRFPCLSMHVLEESFMFDLRVNARTNRRNNLSW